MKVKPNPDGSWTIVNSKGKPMLGLDGQPVRYLTEAEAQETLKLLPPEDSAVSPRQQAMDMIKKMAAFYGWDIVERAENILAKRLEGASDDMILKTFIPQLLSGLGDELLAEAGEQQWRLDVDRRKLAINQRRELFVLDHDQHSQRVSNHLCPRPQCD